MSAKKYQPITFNLRTAPGSVIDWNLFYMRAEVLVKAAIALGAKKGCRIRDERTGFDFDWRPA